jgi:hypothetical protein
MLFCPSSQPSTATDAFSCPGRVVVDWLMKFMNYEIHSECQAWRW